MTNAAILYPILTLVGWTFVMWIWMYATRIPAIQTASIDVDELARTGSPLVLPITVSRVSDNYNHLHEQPTVFYALVLCAALLGAVDTVQVALTWGYVGLRIVHSLVQATTNLVLVRFGVFVLASIVLFVLFLRTVYIVL